MYKYANTCRTTTIIVYCGIEL